MEIVQFINATFSKIVALVNSPEKASAARLHEFIISTFFIFLEIMSCGFDVDSASK